MADQKAIQKSIQNASRRVSQWSEAKRIAFQQRTGVKLRSKPKTRKRLGPTAGSRGRA